MLLRHTVPLNDGNCCSDIPRIELSPFFKRTQISCIYWERKLISTLYVSLSILIIFRNSLLNLCFPLLSSSAVLRKKAGPWNGLDSEWTVKRPRPRETGARSKGFVYGLVPMRNMVARVCAWFAETVKKTSKNCENWYTGFPVPIYANMKLSIMVWEEVAGFSCWRRFEFCEYSACHNGTWKRLVKVMSSAAKSYQELAVLNPSESALQDIGCRIQVATQKSMLSVLNEVWNKKEHMHHLPVFTPCKARRREHEDQLYSGPATEIGIN